MADFLLKVTKADYEDKLTLLESAISELEGVRSEYQTLLGQLDDVMESTSDQFAKTEENVKENIRAIEKSIKNAQNARDSVKASVDAYDEFGAQAQSTLQSAGEAAKSYVEAATKTASILP